MMCQKSNYAWVPHQVLNDDVATFQLHGCIWAVNSQTSYILQINIMCSDHGIIQASHQSILHVNYMWRKTRHHPIKDWVFTYSNSSMPEPHIMQILRPCILLKDGHSPVIRQNTKNHKNPRWSNQIHVSLEHKPHRLSYPLPLFRPVSFIVFFNRISKVSIQWLEKKGGKEECPWNVLDEGPHKPRHRTR